jgi:vacuolar-type H+-ATPase subunit I/STV1
MTISSYVKLTNLFLATAILAAFVYDRLDVARPSAAIVGGLVAVAAIALYFLHHTFNS